MLDTLPARLGQAREKHMLHEDFLLLLCHDEIDRRQSQATQLRAHKAGLDPTMVANAWDETANVTYDRDKLAELLTLRFVDDHQNVQILGPVGVGKTFWAHALGHLACARGLKVVCEPAIKLHRALRGGRLDQTWSEQMRRLCATDVLIIDDFAQQPLTEHDTGDFSVTTRPPPHCSPFERNATLRPGGVHHASAQPGSRFPCAEVHPSRPLDRG